MHVVAVGGTAVYLTLRGPGLAAGVIALVLTAVTIFCISAGYHRLFAHRTYEAHPVLRFFLLTMGAGAFQNSAIVWAADHRRHHARTDTPEDPYSAAKGFWHSHVGWVMRKADPGVRPTPVPDLERDPLVRWQRRHYALIGIATGLVLPTLLGLAFGDPWGGFVVGGAVRLMVVYHVTFSINSLAHWLGSQPYSNANSARDSFLTALISMGEGYHNYHHTFPADYRNGVRAHHFDPTKWVVRILATVGLARKLRRTPASLVLRARLRMDDHRLALKNISPAARERLHRLRAAVDDLLERWRSLEARCEAMRLKAKALRAEIRALRREVVAAYRRWQRALGSLEAGGFATSSG